MCSLNSCSAPWPSRHQHCQQHCQHSLITSSPARSAGCSFYISVHSPAIMSWLFRVPATQSCDHASQTPPNQAPPPPPPPGPPPPAVRRGARRQRRSGAPTRCSWRRAQASHPTAIWRRGGGGVASFVDARFAAFMPTLSARGW